MPAHGPAAGTSTPRRIPTFSLDWPGVAGGAILAAGTIAIYCRTFSVPLLLDDSTSIADNLSIRRLWPLWPVLTPPNDAGVGGRPLLNVSYALNYAVGGNSVFGYHLVNLIIHLLAGWTLFALVRRTLLRPVLAKRFGSVATFLAIAVGALWAWHPVQTVSVTYLSQRAESLMGLFYLLTLYCFVRGAETDDKNSSRWWFSLSVLACLAGVGTKEVIATAPLAVLLYDRTFISGSFSGALRRRRLVYLSLASTWIPLGCLMTGLHHRGVGFTPDVAWWAYGLTECQVIVRYLVLAFWPHPLVFDHGMYVNTPLPVLWPYVLVMASLLTATVVALRRLPVLGFAACWFFLILAPTSSIVPVVGQPMAENRLYLPLAGIVAFVAVGVFSLIGRRSWPVFAVVAAGLGLASAQRNLDYSSELVLWRDTVAKSPANSRAHNNLGNALFSLDLPDRLPEAIAEMKTALRLKPDLAAVHVNLGNALDAEGRTKEAIAEYEEALRLKPDLAEAHNNLGNLLAGEGRTDQAIAECTEALRLRPGLAQAHDNLGNALNAAGRTQEAIAEFEEALRLNPDLAEAHTSLGNALNGEGRTQEAIAEHEAALRLKPNLAAAHNNLGNALSGAGRTQEAIFQFEAALRLKPDDAVVHSNLGNALNAAGRRLEAIAEYEAALRLKPDDAQTHANLGYDLERIPGRLNDSIAEYETALRLKPDDAAAHYNLGNVLNTQGRTHEAILQYEAALRLKPDYAVAHYNFGNALHNEGRTEEAIVHYEEALRLRPDLAAAHTNLGYELEKMPGRLTDAIAEYEAALRLKPEDVAANFNLAIALLKTPGRAGEAVPHLEAVLRLQPGNETARKVLERIRAAQP